MGKIRESYSRMADEYKELVELLDLKEAEKDQA